jgi:23S rRNA (cytosine1962-C5)-methyltransferase
MFLPDQYQLCDFGDGRRLERFGPLTLDRPCPAAENVNRSDPAAWDAADARFERTDDKIGRWAAKRKLPDFWTVRHEPFRLELKRTEFGHLGVFPEQAPNWDWVAQQVRDIAGPARVLNLFAYTGGSTLAAAAEGAEVTHVDGAGNVVNWARRNAELSEMADAPIRWITEDATKFVRRELKRGNGYDAVVLDPPSYGHGPRGEVWRLSKHLAPLLEMCAQLTAGGRRFMLLTCHTPKFGSQRLAAMVKAALGDADSSVLTSEPMKLPAIDGRHLPSGVVVRWTG